MLIINEAGNIVTFCLSSRLLICEAGEPFSLWDMFFIFCHATKQCRSLTPLILAYSSARITQHPSSLSSQFYVVPRHGQPALPPHLTRLQCSTLWTRARYDLRSFTFVASPASDTLAVQHFVDPSKIRPPFFYFRRFIGDDPVVIPFKFLRRIPQHEHVHDIRDSVMPTTSTSRISLNFCLIALHAPSVRRDIGRLTPSP